MPEYIHLSETNPKSFFTHMVKIGGGAYGNVFVAKPKASLFRHSRLPRGVIPSKVAIKTCKCRTPSDFLYIKEEVKSCICLMFSFFDVQFFPTGELA